MFGTHDLALFVLSGLLLNLTPGPDNILILSRSASDGRLAGLSAAAGIVSGTFVHILAAAFGLSAILATSANAFMLVSYSKGLAFQPGQAAAACRLALTCVTSVSRCF